MEVKQRGGGFFANGLVNSSSASSALTALASPFGSPSAEASPPQRESTSTGHVAVSVDAPVNNAAHTSSDGRGRRRLAHIATHMAPRPPLDAADTDCILLSNSMMWHPKLQHRSASSKEKWYRKYGEAARLRRAHMQSPLQQAPPPPATQNGAQPIWADLNAERVPGVRRVRVLRRSVSDSDWSSDWSSGLEPLRRSSTSGTVKRTRSSNTGRLPSLMEDPTAEALVQQGSDSSGSVCVDAEALLDEQHSDAPVAGVSSEECVYSGAWEGCMRGGARKHMHRVGGTQAAARCSADAVHRTKSARNFSWPAVRGGVVSPYVQPVSVTAHPTSTREAGFVPAEASPEQAAIMAAIEAERAARCSLSNVRKALRAGARSAGAQPPADPSTSLSALSNRSQRRETDQDCSSGHSAAEAARHGSSAVLQLLRTQSDMQRHTWLEQGKCGSQANETPAERDGSCMKQQLDTEQTHSGTTGMLLPSRACKWVHSCMPLL